ncbi:acyl carrier protein [Geminicoccus sp.]|uniref:acyl carrier protein n=1 Tax=Geminicoccus sp. TaxID=2024832 RepID=UPI0039C8A808
MRVQARLESTLGRDVPVLELFGHPTVARLAAWLEGEGKAVTMPVVQPRRTRRRDLARP